jgi:hypothetical protein
MKPTTALFVLALCCLAARADDGRRGLPVKEPALRSELLRRTKADQDARHAWIEWMMEHGANGVVDPAALSEAQQAELARLRDAVATVDADNTEWLKGVVDKHGWPTYTLVGANGADAAWLLVQHADADAKFQRRCLDLMSALPKNEASQTKLAYLTDRVLLAEGKKQLYGTQFTSVDGKWQPRPLEDETNVDQRRAAVGLPPLAEYARQIEEQYGGGKK